MTNESYLDCLAIDPAELGDATGFDDAIVTHEDATNHVNATTTTHREGDARSCLAGDATSKLDYADGGSTSAATAKNAGKSGKRGRPSKKSSAEKSTPRKRKKDILTRATEQMGALGQQPFPVTSIPIVEAVAVAQSTSVPSLMGMRSLGIELTQADTILDGVRSVVRSMMTQGPNLPPAQLEEHVKIEMLTFFVMNDVKKLLASCTDTHIVPIEGIVQTVATALLRMNVSQ